MIVGLFSNRVSCLGIKMEFIHTREQITSVNNGGHLSMDSSHQEWVLGAAGHFLSPAFSLVSIGQFAHCAYDTACWLLRLLDRKSVV